MGVSLLNSLQWDEKKTAEACSVRFRGTPKGRENLWKTRKSQSIINY